LNPARCSIATRLELVGGIIRSVGRPLALPLDVGIPVNVWFEHDRHRTPCLKIDPVAPKKAPTKGTGLKESLRWQQAS
jgi:hypothetical protein